MHLYRCAALALAGVLSTVAAADSIYVNGLVSASTEGLGKFSATLDYSVLPSGDGQLVVTIANKSPDPNGGFLTGFMFNFVSEDPDAVAILQPGALFPFSNATGSAAPFGNFEAGAALGGNWLGGGSPNGGIPIGLSGTFTFLIIAEDAASLTAEDFVKGPNQYNFVVRFRGFNNGGSDKVPGVQTCACDYNVDGAVDFGDLGLLLAAWGPAPAVSVFDTNADDKVDGADLGLFLLCWRQCWLMGN